MQTAMNLEPKGVRVKIFILDGVRKCEGTEAEMTSFHEKLAEERMVIHHIAQSSGSGVTVITLWYRPKRPAPGVSS